MRGVHRREEKLDGKEITEQEVKGGREVAKLYSQILQVKFPYAKRFLAARTPEETKWWTAFLRTYRVIAELEADPKTYIQAQFERFMWCKKFPWPNALPTDNGVLAYLQRNGKLTERADRKERSATAVMVDPFTLEQRKLENWARRLNASSRHVLRHYPGEFTAAFHRSKGTWEMVRESFAE